MEITQLTSVFNLAASLICFVASARMYVAIKEKNEVSVNVKYYMYALLLIALYLLAGALPVLVLKDAYLISLVATVFRPLLLFGGVFLTMIPINLSRVKMIKSFYIYASMLVIFSSIALAFMGIRDLGRSSLGNMDVSYLPDIEFLMRPENFFIDYAMFLVGVFFVASMLFSTVFYVRFAIKERSNDIAFGKAVMMALGCFLFLGAGFSNYVLGLSPMNFLLTSITASLLFMTGSVAFIASVNYKGEKYKLKNK